MMYVIEKLWSKHRTELETEHVEALWTEIRPFKSQRSLLIAGVYRPPSSTLEMDTLLEQNIENACLEGKEIMISGDMNIDFLKRESFTKHRVTKALRNLHMSQLMDKITRPISAERIIDISIKNIGLSDHIPTFATRRYTKSRDKVSNHHKLFKYRDFKKLVEKAFNEALKSAPWDTTFIFEDTDDIMDSWYKIFNDIVNDNIPMKEKRVKRQSQPKWFTEEINLTFCHVIISYIN